MWAVWRAKANDGRATEPPTAHDADTAWAVAEMLHAVAGQGRKVASAPASSSAPTTRRLSQKIEEGLAEGVSQSGAPEGEGR